MIRSAALVAGAAVVAASARAQSFNLDSCTISAPPPTLGAAAAQPGAWNVISLYTGASTTLFGLDGVMTTVHFRYLDSATGCVGMSNCGAPWPHSALLCEAHYPNVPTDDIVCRFDGLAAGSYELYTLCRSYDFSTPDGSLVEVNGSLDPMQFVGGPFAWTGQYQLGKTHARHRCTVASDGALEFRIVGAPWPMLNGLQLVYLGQSNFSTYCTAGNSAIGCSPRVIAVGTASASSVQGFRISVVSAQAGVACRLFYGIQGPDAIPFAPVSSSTLCVRTPLQSFLSWTTVDVQSACSGSAGSDWNRFSHSLGNPPLGAPFAAGQTVQVQAWCADSAAMRGVLSDAIEFVVQP